MSTSAYPTNVYPVHVDATLDTAHLSRALWLVKWLLAIPHFVVLAFLWVAFFFLSVIAFFAILFTGRYPHAVFDFNVGVLRWSWRVAYYAYGALGTDRYPPFTLNEVEDYPAHLTIDYPEHLSRGLVLVKWWLLAIPQYLIVGFLAGSGAYVVWDTTQSGNGAQYTYSGGLIGLLALFAAVALLFTGRYPQQIFDLVLGLNRWVLRVSAYAGLMTDQYPPFRLDMGGSEPAGLVVSTPPGGSPGAAGAERTAEGSATAPGAGTAAPTAAQPSRGTNWGAGRVVAVVFAALLFLVGGGFLAGGTTLAVAGGTLRNDQGFLMSPTLNLDTASYAIASEPLTIDNTAAGDFVPRSLLGDVSVRVNGGAEDLFVGVARSADADAYLSGVEHSTLTDVTGFGANGTPVYRDSGGGAPDVPPGDVNIADTWVATATGTGQQAVTWTPEAGDWTVVVMKADGSPGVAADVSIGAELPVLGGVVAGLLIVGGILLVLSVVLVIIALSVGRNQPAPAARGTGPGAGGTAPPGDPGAGPTPGGGA
jgi:hypothetical protein